jgi:hypothetical protein
VEKKYSIFVCRQIVAGGQSIFGNPVKRNRERR